MYVRGGSFKKQAVSGGTASGVIYGYAEGDDKSNTVVSRNVVQTNSGSAVYISSSALRRETTAGQTDYLDSELSGSAGGWE